MSDICGSPQTGSTAGALDEQKAPTHMNRADLEYAIGNVERNVILHRTSLVLLAARAHLATLPKTKIVAVWHVEYAVWACEHGWEPRIETCADSIIAHARVLKMREMNGLTVISITGPHKHEVPA